MASKKERLRKKRESRNRREDHKDKQRKKNKTGISFRNKKPKQIKRALDNTLSKAEKTIQKAQRLNETYSDKENIYNIIIQRFENIVNDLKPIHYNASRINIDLPSMPNLDELKDIALVENQDTSILGIFNENHATSLSLETDNWSAFNLEHLDMLINALKEYYGIGSNSTFEENYLNAGAMIGDETKAEDDLNKIINEEVERGQNDADRTAQLIEYRFERMVAERFDNSDRVKQQHTLNKTAHRRRRSPKHR